MAITDDNDDDDDYRRDEGYSWVVLACVFVVAFFHLGIIKVFGVFIPVLVEQMDLSMWSVGFCVSVGVASNSLLGPVWTAASHLASYRKLTIVGGLLSSVGVVLLSLSESVPHIAACMLVMGIGSGLPLVGRIMAIKDYFERRFTLANCVAYTEGALGIMTLAPLLEYLIEVYGWRGALMLFGATNLNVCAAGALLKSPQIVYKLKTRDDYSEISSSSDSSMDKESRKEPKGVWTKTKEAFFNYFGFSVLVDYPFVTMYLTSISLHLMVVGGWSLYLVPYAVDVGYSTQTASFLTGLGGAGALLGRLAVGSFIDGGHMSATMMYCALTIGSAVVLFCYPLTDVYWILCALSSMSGFLLMSAMPIFITMLKEVLPEGSGYFAGAVGLHYMTRGIGTLIGTQMTGYLYDQTGSFYMSFVTLAALDVSAAVISLVKPTYLTERRR